MTFPTLLHAEPARMLALGRYEVARRAVAEARTIDDTIEVLGRASAIHAYARQAKDRQMEIDAAEIRIRAERRLGELMALQKTAVGAARSRSGGRTPKESRGRMNPAISDGPPTLAEAGIDKNLAKRARSYAAVPTERFEQLLTDKRQSESRGVVLDPVASAANMGNGRLARLVAELRRRIATLVEEIGALKASERMWKERAIAAGWSERVG